MCYLKKLTTYLLLFFLFTLPVLAHKNFWEIKATALPEGESISFTLMFSLDQLQEFFDDKLKLTEYKHSQKAEILEKLVQLAPAVLTLRESGKKLSPFVKSVNIFISEDLAQEETLSLSAVDIDIELVFFSNSNKIDGQWHIYADNLLKKKNIDIATLPEGALNVSIYFLDENSSKFTINSTNKSFEWKRAIPPQLQALKSISSTKTIESKSSLLPIVLISLAIIIWVFTSTKTAVIIPTLLVSISIFSYSTSFFSSYKTETSYRLPEELDLKEFMSKAIHKLYISANSTNNDFKWNTLSGICTDRFREKTFISNFSSKDQKVSHFVESIHINTVKQISEKEIECTWTADALFQHISHIHEKSMSFKAVFHFEANDNSWLINDVNIRRQL